MCRYQAWEDDALQSEDLIQSATDGIDVTGTRLAARLANLEERMTRVEARVERLKARMMYLQKGMRFVCVLFLVTLVYAMSK